jgi:ABC-type Fe3+-siderophore transport system permease subunit
MQRILRKRIASDDVLGWTAVAVALIAAIVLDKGSAPHKWHAAIIWTVVAFLGLLKFSQRKWNSWRFWIFCVACLGLHVFAMWAIFGQLLPRLVLGTLYVIPLAIVEAIFLTGIFYRLERKLAHPLFKI